MADSEHDLRAEWLKEPPRAGEVRIMIDLGEGAELTPEARASLERLMNDLNEVEVAGYAQNLGGFNFGIFGGTVFESTCKELTCKEHSCGQLTCGEYKSAYA